MIRATHHTTHTIVMEVIQATHHMIHTIVITVILTHRNNIASIMNKSIKVIIRITKE